MRKTNKAAMLAAFDEFAQRIASRYDEARARLDRDDYVGAMEVLNSLTKSHAKTALSLRNVLVRDGKLGDES